MRFLKSIITFAASLLVMCSATAQVQVEVPPQYLIIQDLCLDNFPDVTGSSSVFDTPLDEVDGNATLYMESDSMLVASANIICNIKKGEILYYTDLSGSTAPGVFDERNMSLSVDNNWSVKMCYFDEMPTKQPRTSKYYITRDYLKYYRAGGDVGNLNEDYFLGNVANNMWLMAYEDSYVMFAGRFKIPYLDAIENDVNDGYLKKIKHPFALQHIGHFESFDLYPSDGIHSSFASWVKDQKFSVRSSSAEVVFKLSNDISCHAVDTYGKTINLDCPQFCWTVDLQKGTATYTPYFAPKQGASYMLTGDPQLCNLTESAPTNKTFLLWGDDAGDKPTGLTDANATDFSVRGGLGSVTLSGVSGSVQAFSMSGVKVLDVVADGEYALAPGVYAIQSGPKAQLVTVR